jgi:hypothetical protein
MCSKACEQGSGRHFPKIDATRAGTTDEPTAVTVGIKAAKFFGDDDFVQRLVLKTNQYLTHNIDSQSITDLLKGVYIK